MSRGLGHRANVNTRQISSFTYVNFVTSSAGSITVPTGIQNGDIAFLIDGNADASASKPQPAGTVSAWPLVNYTSGRDDGNEVTYHAYINYRILNGTEGNTSVSLTDGSSVDRKALIIFRPNIVTRYTPAFLDIAAETTINTPSNQTINASGNRTPLIVFTHFWGGVGAAVSTMTASDNIFNGSSDRQQVGYKIYNYGQSAIDITVTKNDQGENNVLQSFYFKPIY